MSFCESGSETYWNNNPAGENAIIKKIQSIARKIIAKRIFAKTPADRTASCLNLDALFICLSSCSTNAPKRGKIKNIRISPLSNQNAANNIRSVEIIKGFEIFLEIIEL